MTNRKNTKRALFASVISMLLCVTMLIGSTFAWFTDTATTKVNSIQAGTLDVSLQMLEDGEWVNAEGKTLGFVDEDGNILTDILWEPGCRYLLQPFRIVNNGNLALKFDIVVSSIFGDVKLAEAIEYGIPLGSVDDPQFVSMGELSDFNSIFDSIENAGLNVLNPGESMDTASDAITFQMKPTAGNEYQGLTISGFSITVCATQATVEADSFDDQYDANAEYANAWDGTQDDEVLENNTDEENKTILITTAEEFAAFAASVNEGNTYAGYTVTLAADIDLNNLPWTPIGTSNNPFSGTFDGQGHTISNLYIEKTVENLASSNRQGLFGTVKPVGATYIQNVKLHNVDITGGYHVGGLIGAADGSSQDATGNYLVVTNIEMTGLIQVYGWEGVGGVMGSGNMAEISNITINASAGSYVTTVPDGRTNSFACVGSVMGGGYFAKADNIISNLDVTAKTAGTGGLFGVVGGQNVACNLSNLSYSGKVTLTESSVDLYGNYSNYQYNGLLVGAPRFTVIADQSTCTSTGTLELHTENDVVYTSNNMSDAFTWGGDLFGASRDKTYTNKSYATDYTG